MWKETTIAKFQVLPRHWHGESENTAKKISGWRSEPVAFQIPTMLSLHAINNDASDTDMNRLSICGSTVLLLELGRFFSFLFLYTVGRTPWTGTQPVAKPLLTQRTA
jgi:hypothetical protein